VVPRPMDRGISESGGGGRSVITRRLGLLLLLALLAAPDVGARQHVEAQPEIADLTFRTDGEEVWTSYRLEGCLTEEVMERIHSGIPIRFRHKIEMVEKRPGLFAADRVFARTLIDTRVEYDSLTQRYQLNRTLEVRSRQKRAAPPPTSNEMVTGSIDEMQAWMTLVTDVPLGDPSRPFPDDVDLNVRVEVSLGRHWFLLIIPTTESIVAEVPMEAGP
jgi:hypothetical protein